MWPEPILLCKVKLCLFFRAEDYCMPCEANVSCRTKTATKRKQKRWQAQPTRAEAQWAHMSDPADPAWAY